MSDLYRYDPPEPAPSDWRFNVIFCTIAGVLTIGPGLVAYLLNDPVWLWGYAALLILGLAG